MTPADYQALRERWRPGAVELLLVGESAPAPDEASLRFFYAPVLSAHDNLFRGVVGALYDATPGRAGDPKDPWLRRLRRDGVYLIDLVPLPVNRLSRLERRMARRAHIPECVAEAAALRPKAVAICHGPTFNDIRGAFVRAGLPVIHDRPIPFPIGPWRARFAAELADAAGGAGLRFPRGHAAGQD